MTKIESGIDVDVPVATAYSQWTQFEDFPRFMKHVRSIRQTDDAHLHWKVEIGGKEIEFDAKIVEQIPDKRIAWRSIVGPTHSGVVTFHRLGAAKCRVMVQLDYDPQGFIQNVASWVGIPQVDLEQDLERFVAFLETRGAATGSWRGTIPNQDDNRSAGQQENA